MLPTLRPGDQVLILRPTLVHPKQIVVAKLGKIFIIKRVLGRKGNLVELGSDNPHLDQRRIVVPRSDILGVVFFVQKFDEAE